MKLMDNHYFYKPYFLSRIAIYLKERFPVHIAFIYSVLFSFCVLVFSFNKISLDNLLSVPFIVVIGTLFLFFLRLRFIDEIKDYHYDSKYHLDRPVARGVLSLKEVIFLIILVVALELTFQIGNSWPAIIIFGIFLIYSYLMYKEFFARRLLIEHFFFALMLHQFIFIIFTIYALSTMQRKLPVFSPLTIYFLIFMFAPPFIFEIGRKLEHRKNLSGQITDDTYIYRWGLGRSFFLLMSMATIQGVMMLLLLPNFLYMGLIYIIFLAIIWVLYVKNPEVVSKTAKYWSVLLALSSMIFFIVGKII